MPTINREAMCTFVCCCLPWLNDETSEISDSPRTPSRLLEQATPSSASQPSAISSSSMRGPLRRTYGKKTAGKVAVAAVFGVANESSPLLQGQQSSRLSSGSRQASLRDPLVDITSVVENLTVAEISESADAGILATAAVENDSVADNLTTANASELSKVSGLPSVVQNDPDSIYNDESATTTHRGGDVPHNLGYLKELFAAYQLDRGHTLPVKSWDEITEGDLSIVKIAEASYAEVYRVTTKYGTSILKVMQLKIPSDPPSMDSYTTVGVKSIMAEIRITNAMTEIPGFVSFRDVHLVQGKPNTAISDAWKAYLLQFTDSTPDIPTSNSYFPDPDSYADQSVFLVIELGDAGEVLQHFRVDTRHKVFDIFLGTALVLSRAEQESDFEHRDLHENNICVSRHTSTEGANDLPEHVLFGRSGLAVTLIDYGLSRAKLPTGEVAFYDLEQDLAVFRGEDGKPQYDTYRRMRSHLFTGGRNMFKRTWHTEESRAKNNGHTWAEHIPYTNALWLKYLFGWLREQYLKGIALENHPDLWYNIPGVRELNRRFDLRTKQGFDSATEVLIFAVEQGWIINEQIEESGINSTILSEYSIVRD